MAEGVVTGTKVEGFCVGFAWGESYMEFRASGGLTGVEGGRLTPGMQSLPSASWSNYDFRQGWALEVQQHVGRVHAVQSSVLRQHRVERAGLPEK